MKKILFNFICIVTVFVVFGCNSQPVVEKVDGAKEDTSTLNSPVVKSEDTAEATTTASKEELLVHFIDVGQGDATLFQFSDEGQDYAILIDAGDFTGDEVAPYLKQQGIEKINVAIGTHPDADHIGQLDQVINQFDVEEVWLSGNTSSSDTFQRLLEAIVHEEIDYEEPRMGEQYDIGPLHLEVLYPEQISGKANEESISLKLTYGDVRFMLTGDAETQNELEMIQSGADLEADFLHLGHHGSSTSTSKQFLDAVHPKIAIYSSGADNSYGHPHAEVVSLVQSSDIELYGTDVHGTIVVSTNGKEYSVETLKSGTISQLNSEDEPAKEETSEVTQNSCININSAFCRRSRGNCSYRT